MAMNESITAQSERVMAAIKNRAMEFCLDNMAYPTEKNVLMITNAMLIGASIALEDEAATQIERNR